MRTRLAGWLVVVGVLVGAGVAGHHLGDRPMLAAQSGTSTSGGGTDGTSGSSGGGTSGDGSSGTSGGGGGGGGETGGGGTGGGGSGSGGGGGGTPAPAPTAPTSGGGGGPGSASGQEDDDSAADGTSGFSPADDGGGDHDDEPYTLRPAEPAPERRRVAPGRRTECPADTPAEVRCFGVDDWDDADAVEVPDGAGGTVVVPLVADVDTRVEGTSVSGGSNVDLRVHINITDGTVVDVDRRADDTTQAVLLTLAVILLVLVLVGLGGTLLRLQGLGG